MNHDITELFCFVDDFCKEADKEIKKYHITKHEKFRKPTRKPEISDSEIITILLLYPNPKKLRIQTSWI
jgi:hypothetical protein